jgi:hypothetical protein
MMPAFERMRCEVQRRATLRSVVDVELGAERRRAVPFAVDGEGDESVKLRLHALTVRLGPSGSQLRYLVRLCQFVATPPRIASDGWRRAEPASMRRRRGIGGAGVSGVLLRLRHRRQEQGGRRSPSAAQAKWPTAN